MPTYSNVCSTLAQDSSSQPGLTVPPDTRLVTEALNLENRSLPGWVHTGIARNDPQIYKSYILSSGFSYPFTSSCDSSMVHLSNLVTSLDVELEKGGNKILRFDQVLFKRPTTDGSAMLFPFMCQSESYMLTITATATVWLRSAGETYVPSTDPPKTFTLCEYPCMTQSMTCNTYPPFLLNYIAQHGTANIARAADYLAPTSLTPADLQYGSKKTWSEEEFQRAMPKLKLQLLTEQERTFDAKTQTNLLRQRLKLDVNQSTARNDWSEEELQSAVGTLKLQYLADQERKLKDEVQAHLLRNRLGMEAGQVNEEPGGLYIVEGTRKTFLTGNNMRNNMPYLIPGKKGEMQCRITCVPDLGSDIEVHACDGEQPSGQPSGQYRVKIRANDHKSKILDPQIIYVYLKQTKVLNASKFKEPRDSYHVRFPELGAVGAEPHVGHLFTILGLSDADEIIGLIRSMVPEAFRDRVPLISIKVYMEQFKSDHPNTQLAIKNEIVALHPDTNSAHHIHSVISGTNEERIAATFSRVETLVFHHMNHIEPKTVRMNLKCKLLAFMVARIAMYYARIAPPDQRDSYAAKRCRTGPLLLLYYFRETLLQQLRERVCGKVNSAQDFSNTWTNHEYGAAEIKRNLNNILAGRELNTKRRGSSVKTEMTLAYKVGGSIAEGKSQIRRSKTNSSPKSRSHDVHHINGGAYGVLCPIESPDSGQIGLVTNFASAAQISIATLIQNVLKHICQYFVSTIPTDLSNNPREKQPVIYWTYVQRQFFKRFAIKFRQDFITNELKLVDPQVLKYLDDVTAKASTPEAKANVIIDRIKAMLYPTIMGYGDAVQYNDDKPSRKRARDEGEAEKEEEKGYEAISPIYTSHYRVKFFANGILRGFVAMDLCDWLREQKRLRKIPPMTMVAQSYQWDSEDILYCSTEEQRPLFPALLCSVNTDTQSKFYGFEMPNFIQLNPTTYQTYDQLEAIGNCVELIDSFEAEHHMRVGESAEQVLALSNDMIRQVIMFMYTLDKKAKELSTVAYDYTREPCPPAILLENITFMDGIDTFRGIMSIPVVTHMLMHPQQLFSNVAGMLPMFEATQGSRGPYAAGMGKQTLGTYSGNGLSQFPTNNKLLVYPTVPLFDTDMDHLSGLGRAPAGVRLLVAVMPWKTLNDEDAVVLNRKSLHKLASIKEFSKTAIIQHTGGSKTREVFAIDKSDLLKHKDKYSNIDPSNGLARPGAYLKPGDVVIARYRVTNNVIEVNNVTLSWDESGVVSHAYRGPAPTSGRKPVAMVAKVAIRQIRLPEESDKIASRAAQKMTISVITDEMPYLERNGEEPDIIINTMGLTNRMSLNQMFEFLASKVAMLKGTTFNGTAFSWKNSDIVQIMQDLKDMNFNEYGLEWMRHPTTNVRIREPVFVAPGYYWVLKHWVSEKVNARGYAPRLFSTGHVHRGKKSMGASRVGIQERSVYASHGAAFTYREILMEKSDRKTINICPNCDDSTIYVGDNGHVCVKCRGTNWLPVELPYSVLNFMQIIAPGYHVSLSYNAMIKDDPGANDDEFTEEPDDDDDADDDVVPETL